MGHQNPRRTHMLQRVGCGGDIFSVHPRRATDRHTELHGRTLQCIIGDLIAVLFLVHGHLECKERRHCPWPRWVGHACTFYRRCRCRCWCLAKDRMHLEESHVIHLDIGQGLQRTQAGGVCVTTRLASPLRCCCPVEVDLLVCGMEGFDPRCRRQPIYTSSMFGDRHRCLRGRSRRGCRRVTVRSSAGASHCGWHCRCECGQCSRGGDGGGCCVVGLAWRRLARWHTTWGWDRAHETASLQSLRLRRERLTIAHSGCNRSRGSTGMDHTGAHYRFATYTEGNLSRSGDGIVHLRSSVTLFPSKFGAKRKRPSLRFLQPQK